MTSRGSRPRRKASRLAQGSFTGRKRAEGLTGSRASNFAPTSLLWQPPQRPIGSLRWRTGLACGEQVWGTESSDLDVGHGLATMSLTVEYHSMQHAVGPKPAGRSVSTVTVSKVPWRMKRRRRRKYNEWQFAKATDSSRLSTGSIHLICHKRTSSERRPLEAASPRWAPPGTGHRSGGHRPLSRVHTDHVSGVSDGQAF